MNTNQSSEAAGYASFVQNKRGFPERLTSASSDWTCPNCGERVRAHRMHMPKDCPAGDLPPKYWLDNLLDAI
jgi:hypothetical protein